MKELFSCDEVKKAVPLFRHVGKEAIAETEGIEVTGDYEEQIIDILMEIKKQQEGIAPKTSWQMNKDTISSETINSGAIYNVLDEDYVIIRKGMFKIEGEDLDLRFSVNKRDIGFNVYDLREWGITSHNIDWWLSRVDTTETPPVYYLSYYPDPEILPNLKLSFINNESSSRDIIKGTIMYETPE